MIALPSAYDREPFQPLRPSETCEACGHKGWCMQTSTTIWCMRNPDGAYATKVDKNGATVYLHRRTGAPAPTPIRVAREARHDAPSPITCRLLYTMLADRYAGTSAPKPALAADERRFGKYAHMA